MFDSRSEHCFDSPLFSKMCIIHSPVKVVSMHLIILLRSTEGVHGKVFISSLENNSTRTKMCLERMRN